MSVNRLATTAMQRVFGAVTMCIALAGCRSGGSQVSTAPMVEPGRVRHGDVAAIARAREDSMRRPYTAADVHFMTGMISHHAQADAWVTGLRIADP